MSDYYSSSGTPGTRSSLSSAAIRAEFALIDTGLGKVAPLTGNGGKLIKINSAGTAQEPSAVISDNGSLCFIGGTASRSVGGAARTVQIEKAATQASVSIARNSNDAFGGTVALAKSRGTALGSSTVLQNSDTLGEVIFAGADGTDVETQGATIRADVDGTPGANDMPTRIVFSTTADGASTVTERMRISSAGVVTITGSVATTGDATLGGNVSLSRASSTTVARADNTGYVGVSGGVDLSNGMNILIGGSSVSAFANVIAMRSGTTELARLNSAGFGVGRTPTEVAEFLAAGGRARMVIETTAAGNTASIQLKSTAGSAQWQWSAGVGSTDNMTFGTVAGTEVMRLLATGHAGIGMTPANRLDVAQAANAPAVGQIVNSDAGAAADARWNVSNGTTIGGIIMRGTGHAAAGNLLMYVNGANPIVFYTNSTEKVQITSTGALLVTGGSGTLGYGTGSGGTVTQATSKATGVTLNKATGQITLNAASLAANTAAGFTLTNSTIATSDIVIVNIDSGATVDSYHTQVDTISAGSCRISLRNMTGGALAEAVVLNFAVIKGVTS